MKGKSILLKTFFLSFSFLILISFFKPPLLVSGNSIYISSGIPENGISIGDPFAVCHGYASSEESAQELKDQGVSLSRNDLPWGAVERVSGVYNYKHYDHFYGNLSAQSIRGLAILDYGNSILYGEEYDRYIPSWMIPHWLRYVNETVDRYRTIVDYWEIWNEPNLDKFWSGSDVEFFDLLNSTAHLIKSISPDIKIISPGISGHNPDYLNSMIDYIGDAEFNSLFYALNYHPYSGSNAELITQKTKDVQEVAMAHGYSGEIWITEVGISTQVTSVDRVEEEYQENWDYQGEQLVKTYAQALAAGTDIVVWYCYRDSYPMNWTYGESAFGLQHFWGGDRGLEYKPSGYAYQYLSSILPNGSYFEDGFDLVLPVGSQKSSIHFYYFYTNRNSTLLFLWSTNLEYSSELTLPTEGGGGIFDAMEFDYFTNESNWVSSQTNFQVNIGYTPVLIELEYQDFLGTLGLENTPLIFRVDLNYSREIRFVLIFVPSILVIGGMIGLASSISQKKDLKKEN